MKIMVITSSPNEDGLTAACGKAALEGAKEGGAEVTIVNLNSLKIGTCHACGNGWGPCLKDHECQVKDGFQELHQSMKEFDGFVIVTPVYWGDLSESAKAFFDRLRRCEAWKEETFLQQKPVISVAAAGGSGNGVVPCLTSMERLLTHIKAERFDFIGITRKTRKYKLDTIKYAAKEMVESIVKA
ncbi:flavodoxin family protein [Clostridium sp. OS1-26]|uniref:flavodoxin family protein n=1 Tax=Clostridium sp. OS1-26 TaxID=3070681 RepID=UPI0027E19FD0|nr:flavodoxin family protein [Clostridium sp. OS1-26]WML33642.1 flavodoxin family protein [Clostridium sp. OS1-26]